MGKAHEVRRVTQYGGAKPLFRLDPPVPISQYDYDTDKFVTREYEYVIASSVSNYVCETMIFPSNPHGEITDWGELWVAPGTTNVTLAMEQRGYEIVY